MPVIMPILCEKIGNEIDKMLDKLDSVKDTVINAVNSLRDTLATMTYSTADDINNAVNNVLNNIENLLPNLSEWDDILDAMINCSFLQDQNSSPTSVVNSIKNDYLNKTADGINDLAGGLPEFNAARAFDRVLDQIQTSKIDTNINSINKALTCIESICGLDILSRQSRLNEFLYDCSMDGSGNLDYSKIISDAGITDPVKIDNLNRAHQTFSGVKKQASDKIDEGKSIVKLLSKTSDFF